jgi:hypothetical protein
VTFNVVAFITNDSFQVGETEDIATGQGEVVSVVIIEGGEVGTLVAADGSKVGRILWVGRITSENGDCVGGDTPFFLSRPLSWSDLSEPLISVLVSPAAADPAPRSVSLGSTESMGVVHRRETNGLDDATLTL